MSIVPRLEDLIIERNLAVGFFYHASILLLHASANAGK